MSNFDEPVYVVDVIEDVVTATSAAILATIQANETEIFGETTIAALSYHKGSFDELIEDLSQKDGSREERYKKYPLIYLVRDFEEVRGREAGIYCSVSLRVIIVHQTEQTYKITDRETKVFRPVLYPIYNEFMRQLSLSPMINQSGVENLRHIKIDRAYWGKNQQQGSNKTALNDFVDAIEIRNLELKINYSYC